MSTVSSNPPAAPAAKPKVAEAPVPVKAASPPTPVKTPAAAPVKHAEAPAPVKTVAAPAPVKAAAPPAPVKPAESTVTLGASAKPGLGLYSPGGTVSNTAAPASGDAKKT